MPRSVLRGHGLVCTWTEGDALGIAFQIVDDLLDYGGTAAAIGKNTGDDFRELVVLELRREVGVRQARQIVEPVAVLQRFQLGFEDKVEAGTEHAAKRHFLLGQAADPEVDGVDPGHGHPGNVVQTRYCLAAVQETMMQRAQFWTEQRSWP